MSTPITRKEALRYHDSSADAAMGRIDSRRPGDRETRSPGHGFASSSDYYAAEKQPDNLERVEERGRELKTVETAI
jgi:hypothetical protein